MTEKDETNAPRRGRLADARGNIATLLDPCALHNAGRHDLIEAGALAEIVGQISAEWERQRWIAHTLMGLPALAFVGVVMLLLQNSGGSIGPFEKTWTVVLFAACGLNVGVLWLCIRSARLKRACAIMLDHRCCPHCGGDILGLPTAAEDGATICPECSRAWKLRDSQTAHNGHQPA